MSRFQPATIAGFLFVLPLAAGCRYRTAPVVSEEGSRKEADEGAEQHRPAAERLKEVTADVRDMEQPNNDFALDLYARLAGANQDESLFFSPYSMSSAIAMIAKGARGKTGGPLAASRLIGAKIATNSSRGTAMSASPADRGPSALATAVDMLAGEVSLPQ